MTRNEGIAIRRALADYMSSEGCGCCAGPAHSAHEEVLAKLLRVPKYEDGSGYNFSKYKSSVASGKQGD